jgi:hypothetical protein
MKEIKQLIKHSGAIHIENNITLVQRHIWNVMAEIGRRNPDKTMHEISLNDLMHYLNWGKSHNQDYLKETRLALLRCVVQWNILGKDKLHVWGAMTMLSQVTVQEGSIYAFRLSWRRGSSRPIYAKLDLQIRIVLTWYAACGNLRRRVRSEPWYRGDADNTAGDIPETDGRPGNGVPGI